MITVSKARVQEDSTILAEMNKHLIEDEGHRNPMSVQELRKRMEDWLGSGEWEAVFVNDGPDVGRIGYALYQWRKDPFYPEEEFVYLRQFFISRDHRRRGVGSQAFRAIREKYWKNAKRIEVEVLFNNSAGVAFWHSLGFVDQKLGLELR